MTRRSWIIALLACALSVGLAYALRFALVESQAVAVACTERDGGFACLVRDAAVFAFHSLLLGGLALAGAVLALAVPRLWSFLLALIPAAFALVLYNVELGASAVMLTLLATARAPAGGAAGR